MTKGMTEIEYRSFSRITLIIYNYITLYSYTFINYIVNDIPCIFILKPFKQRRAFYAAVFYHLAHSADAFPFGQGEEHI